MRKFGFLIVFFCIIFTHVQNTQAQAPPKPVIVLSWTDPNTTLPTAIKFYRSSTAGTEQFYQQLTITGTDPLTWTDMTPLAGNNFYVATFVIGGKETGASNETSSSIGLPPGSLASH